MEVVRGCARRRERESPPDDCCRLRFALLSSPSILLSKFASRQRESVDYGVVGGGDGCTVPRASRKNWEGRNIDRGRRSVSGIKTESMARRSDEACSGDDASAAVNAVRWVVGGAMRDTTPARLKTSATG